tara:strand:- start:1059 stop:1610 length:552 start_codon:yes stop_codon:yes gene_type:complete
MLIHKSFSRKDLISICETLSIEIEDIGDFNKHQLTNKLREWSDKNPTALFLPNILCIDTLHQLKTYLSTINQSKINSSQTRELIMKKAKKLIAYGKNGYILTSDVYPSVDDIIEDVEIIIPFGDSPSVRKAIEWINNDSKISEKYFPEISEQVKRKLEEKKTMKKNFSGKLIVKYGHFEIRFD